MSKVLVWENGIKIIRDALLSELPDPTAVAIQARDQRDVLLSQSDWTQVLDAPVDQSAWATYRQALRDVPNQAGFPENIVWPTRPEVT